jgi:hypothetical protein
MTSIKNYKPATVVVAIAALAGMVAASTVAIGLHTAFAADTETTTVTKSTNNTGVNVPTDTNQKQNCVTAGAMSAISMSCTANSNDQVTQSGGLLKK